MENLTINIASALDRVTQTVTSDTLRSALNRYQAKQIWTPHDRSQLLDILAKYLLQPDCTICIGQAFCPLVLDLLERASKAVFQDGHIQLNYHEQLCIALGKLLYIVPDTLGFSVKYFQSTPPLFQSLSDDKYIDGQPPKKKSKKSRSMHIIQHYDLAVTAYRYLTYAPNTFRDIWDWSAFMQLLHSDNTETKWFASQSIAIVVGMNDRQTKELNTKIFKDEEIRKYTLEAIKWNRFASQSIAIVVGMNDRQTKELNTKIFKDEEIRKYTLRCKEMTDYSMHDALLLTNPRQNAELNNSEILTHTQGSIVSSDLVNTITAVCGVLLPLNTTSQTTETPSHLVPVSSMLRNLHCLSLAIANNQPVLLEGPVGCGKTALVEFMAAVTGRQKSPYLLKVQLGDQTDSKALLGTYRCTDVPGEFVWQPGALTQAVTHGYWILLEDIDYAPMDVVSVLVPLLESNTLSVPGHGDTVKAAPGFQLFATQRHDLNIDTEDSDDNSSTNIHHYEGRLISTRDLMKWCARIVTDFDVSLSSTANKVFQEALDCFCAVLSKPSTRLSVAEAIGSKINISKEKADFYCEKYKPSLDIQRTSMVVGRAQLMRLKKQFASLQRVSTATFAHTRHAMALMERVAVCVANNEPVLLVGETGTGKTSSVQYLAEVTGHRLQVINMNQQSDSADLLGGFKPVDMRQIVAPFREEFETLFCKTFSRKQNIKFLGHMLECFAKRKWQDLFKLMLHVAQAAEKKCSKDTEEDQIMKSKWHSTCQRIHQLQTQVKYAESALAFSFIEGTLVNSLRNGEWVLLDEINLATAETLECLSGLLESKSGSVVLMERGDTEPIVRHDNFRLFACMNPATDIGKKDLPPGIRNRFTEFFVDELEEVSDLNVLVNTYLQGLTLTAAQVEGIVKFYLTVRHEAIKKLTDGTGHRPHYSLRTLCRALRQAATNPYGNIPRCLYESFCLSFLTQLDRSSHPVVEQLICQHIIGRSNIKSVLKQPLPPPTDGHYLKIEAYWVSMGDKEPVTPKDYILTSSVRANLRDLVRIVSAGRYPVLLQGETSVGKTSLVNWLANATGNHCVRVNNHEHTDLQEYVGFYAADETGKLVFKEGVLVDAMRKGHWIILDELNLAPTDVLEALNRLLDDNRELFIPETQETVKAHPRFMLFATQNPPGLYGGRKVLSRAFRNRFVELHFDEIPSKELETILHERCLIPLSYCRRMVSCMLELQARRRSSGVFAGKQGYITLRDLFRWAERYRLASTQETTTQKFYDWDRHIADEGYLLLAGKVRRPEEQMVIQEVIEKHIKRRVDPNKLFTLCDKTSATTLPILQQVLQTPPDGFSHIVWTFGMRRLAVLVGQALRFGEPVLLVGETGCGKTTVCQIFAALAKQRLYTVNCHLHTETSDFLGGLRPVRHRQSDIDSEECQKLFEWCDGPLVLAMREGTALLVDEISLADDSVLERLNSVLEPERTLLLAEKGSGESIHSDVEQIVAMDTFRVVATMNPGGDFGKKELSPALRNRFTEIWCPQSNDRDDLINIIEHNISSGIQLCNQEDGSSGLGNAMMDFIEWFANNEVGKRCTISIRDILSWVTFVNTVCVESIEDENHSLDPAVAYIHGACLVFLDGLGAGTTSGSSQTSEKARRSCLKYLQTQMYAMAAIQIDLSSLVLNVTHGKMETTNPIVLTETQFGIHPFFIRKGPVMDASTVENYALHAPTTALNAQRLLRAMQLPKAILLEGSPGVGKTSLVTAMAEASAHQYVRINLSEQTDVTDLFGADLPVEGEEGGSFAWRDGPLLSALKAGHWVVLDELNLASQSVLEGLNACLDHRAEVFVPELGKTFQIEHKKTRIFACQNPLNQGGGRKGLPRSFLNRFTQVHIEPLSAADLLFITSTMYPVLDVDMIRNMIEFNNKLYDQTMVECLWGQRGGPWEFNLRDLFRWCDLMVENQHSGSWNPSEYVGLIYSQRLRTKDDKIKVLQLFQDVFCQEEGGLMPYQSTRQFHITADVLQVGYSFLERSTYFLSTLSNTSLKLLHHLLEPMEALMKCIQMNWMAILVGPHSSGKTSLVQLVSQLTGHRLQVIPMNSSMDTIELLGGFEQADLNRHWEQLVHSLKSVVFDVLKTLLLKNEKKSKQYSKDVLTRWSTLIGLNQSQLRTSQDEEREYNGISETSFEEMDKMLSLVEKCCQKFNVTFTEDVLVSVMARYEKLKSRFRREGSGQGKGGGQFEWIDGLLVQALQNGDWLLIDNVNFCSPSVLDRLNALLEPNGVLSINERGVIDGEIPTIKPHPNFRLILAMDPRHGEISRAMRNRGVEIYILGENEGGNLDAMDLKSLLHGVGLVGKQPCELLINLHTQMKSSLSGPDPCSLLDLLHAASLTVQELQRGNDVASAMVAACRNIYVASQRSYANRKVAKEIIDQHLSDVDFVSMEKLNNSSSLVDAELSGKQLTSETEKNSLESLLLPATLIFFEMATLSDWKLRIQYFSDTIQHKLALTRPATSLNQVTFHQYFPDAFVFCMEKVFGHPLMQKLWSFYREAGLSEKDLNMLYSFPYDSQWNAQVLTSMESMQSRLKLKLAGSSIDVSQLNTITYRLYIVMKRSLREYMEDMVYKMVDKKQQALSAIQLSYALNKGFVTMEFLPEPVLAHLHPFFVTFDHHFDDCILSDSILTCRQMTKVFEALLWRDKLWDVANQTIQDKRLFSLSQLKLHWSWFYKNTLFTIPAILTVDNTQLPAKLSTIVHRIHPLLGADDRIGQSQQLLFSILGQPIPYKTSVAADLTHHVYGLCHSIDVYAGSNNIASLKIKKEQDKRILFMNSSDGGKVVSSLVEILVDAYHSNEIASDNIETLLDKIAEVESCLIKNQLYDDPDSTLVAMDVDDSSSEMTCVKSSVAIETGVQLWPIYQHVSLLQEHRILVSLLRTINRTPQDYLQEYIHQFLAYSLRFLPSQPKHLASYQTALQTLNKDSIACHTSGLVLQYLSYLWFTCVTKHPEEWLSWKSLQDTVAMNLTNSHPFDIENGPGSLYLSKLSPFVFKLLCQSRKPTRNKEKLTQNKDAAGIHEGLHLGMFQEKLDQIQYLADYFWCNGSCLSDNTLEYRRSNWEMLIASFANLFSAFSSFVSEERTPEYLHAVSVLNSDKANCHLSIEILKEVIGSFNYEDPSIISRLDETVESKPLLPVYARELLTECIDCLKLELSANQQASDYVSNQSGSRNKSHDHLTDQLNCGIGWVKLGLLQTLLLAVQGPVDPAEKVAIQLQYTADEIKELSDELEVRNQSSQLLTGLSLTDYRESTLPPRIGYLNHRKECLKTITTELTKKTAIRPTPSKFEVLLQDVQHFTSSIGSANSVRTLLQKLCRAINSRKLGRGKHSIIDAILNEERSWQSSVHQFMKRLQDDYPLYRDLILPFLSGVSQLSHGMRLVAHAVYCKERMTMIEKSVSDTGKIHDTQDLLVTLSRFPFVTVTLPQSIHIAEALCEENTMQLVENIQHIRQFAGDGGGVLQLPLYHYKAKLLKIAVLHTKNHAILKGRLDKQTLELLTQLLGTLVESWKQTEELARLKEEEDAQLFKYKSKLHGDGLTEEEREEKEFKKSYPTFHKDFEDLTEPPSLEAKESDEEKDDGIADTMVTEKLDIDDIMDICKLHQMVYCGLTRTVWFQSRDSVVQDMIGYQEPFLVGYKIAAQLMNNTRTVTDHLLDKELVGSHLLMTHILKNTISNSGHHKSEVESTSNILFNKPFDIYHDPCVEESVQCRQVLEKIVVRVNELLAEWPDHPTLKQEWESNACRAVSLQTHCENVTYMIIQWRKLELSCWSSCLDMVEYRYAQKASKWWYQLYQLVEYYLQHKDDEERTEKLTGVNKFVTNLQQFMEGSGIGEFSTRLQMLLSFHCQTVHREPTPEQVSVSNILWNVHQYYQQFLPVVKSRLQALRSPIEKELKGFVKIARWSDINFWAMKQYVEKSHRTLHKFSKKYETALLEQARNTFLDGNIGVTHQGIPSISGSLITSCLSHDALKMYFEPSVESSEESLLYRLPSLFNKMTKLCRKMFKSCQYPDLMSTLDSFTGEVIETVHQLQALDVSKVSKQKSEAKYINLRKRKALQLGLSYRKGLTNIHLSNQHDALFTVAMDISVAFQGYEDRSAVVTEAKSIWDDCQHYYYRCIARNAAMITAMTTPSKELGVGNIDRCKGFSEHLVQQVYQQRYDISDVLYGAILTRNHLLNLEQLKTSTHEATVKHIATLPPQTELYQWIETAKDIIDQAFDALQQFKLVLCCCPDSKDGAVHPSPIPSQHLAKIETVRQGSETYKEVYELLQECISMVVSQKETLDTLTKKLELENKSTSILTWSHVSLLDGSFAQIDNVLSLLSNIESYFISSFVETSSPLIEPLVCVRTKLFSKSNEFKVWTDKIKTEPDAVDKSAQDETPVCILEGFQEDVEVFVTKLLVAIQKLVKSNIKDAGKDEDEDKEDKNEEAVDLGSQLQEALLVKSLCGGLNVDKTSLDLTNVNKILTGLVTRLCSLRDDCQSRQDLEICNKCASLLLQVVPLVHQYMGVVYHHLVILLTSHRTTSKLLSVLLGIFSELATKGFCLPAEFSDELGGDGSTQFEDIEGGGIGEGEGVKDVSDQIENEDQVQDVKKPGDENAQEDDFDNQHDIKDEEEGIEMSEDFEGKQHEMDKTDQKDGSDESDGDDENELDKQLGKVDGEDEEKLDERMWGSDEEDEEEDGEQKEDEFGPGMDEEESQLVAKDDNQGAGDDNDDRNKDSKEQENEEDDKNEEVQPRNLEPKDESEFNDDEIDPNKANRDPPENTADDLDLSEDLNLDEEMGKDKENEDDQDGEDEGEENPFDIETKPNVEEVKDEESKDEEQEGADELNPESTTDVEDEQKDEEAKDNEMDVDKKADDDDEGNEEEPKDKGTHSQDDPMNDEEETTPPTDEESKPEDITAAKETTEAAEDHEKTHTQQDPVQLSDDVEQHAGKSEEDQKKEEHSTGTAEQEHDEGHEGDMISDIVKKGTNQQKQHQKKPGKSSMDRSLGSADERIEKRLQTVDEEKGRNQENKEQQDEQMSSDLYEHVKDPAVHHDKQTLDAATEEQQQEQPVPNVESDNDVEDMEQDDVDDMQPLQDTPDKNADKIDTLPSTKLKSEKEKDSSAQGDGDDDTDVKIDGEKDDREEEGIGGKHMESTIHTSRDTLLDIENSTSEFNVEKLRSDLEQQLTSWTYKPGSTEEEKLAQEAWHRYESLTTSLSQELCEQLRLVLEPSQATKLRGDYRTGKRLNMRKVIPYIASQFRKDKIWLRRTKPSKRNYQIMLAVDDSSSMADNHSKQLAFESLAVISNALTWLEAGELSVCSFGESVQLLHPFHEQFTSQSGARILQQFTFEQKKTKIAQLLDNATRVMLAARSRQHSGTSHPDTSQLLVIVSDGRGLFLEGSEVVKSAVRAAKEAHIFIVFVVLDNPNNKDSILDIKVPVFKSGGQIMDIRSYMEYFPFPFYIILRDINALPAVLSDALRQWFELVTADTG
ncbi:midasin [Saccoglossus kowalevskii]